MSNRKILVAEDDQTVREVLDIYLSSAGFDVVMFDSADAALKLPNSELRQFEIALTDYDMPGMNGVEFAKLLKTLNPQIHVVVMSGKIELKKTEAAYFGGFIRKPFSLKLLMQRLSPPASAVPTEQGTLSWLQNSPRASYPTT